MSTAVITTTAIGGPRAPVADAANEAVHLELQRTERQIHAATVVAAKADAIAERARLRRERVRAGILAVLPPVLGLALFIGAWALFAQTAGALPAPAEKWAAGVGAVLEPFVIKGPNDQGLRSANLV